MRPGYYSPFWLAGGVLTSPSWAERDALDAPAHPSESLDMGAWLRLSEVERRAVVVEYTRPRRQRVAA